MEKGVAKRLKVLDSADRNRLLKALLALITFVTLWVERFIAP